MRARNNVHTLAQEFTRGETRDEKLHRFFVKSIFINTLYCFVILCLVNDLI